MKKKDLGDLFMYIWEWTKDWEPEGRQSLVVKFINQDGGAMELEQNKKFFDEAMTKKHIELACWADGDHTS